MEYPHNLFPSLHIVLCLIVAETYARHTRGVVRLLFSAWFVLIGVSTLLTWQHHLIDLLGGIVLATLINGLNVAGISANPLNIVFGAAILLSMIANVRLARLRASGRN